MSPAQFVVQQLGLDDRVKHRVHWHSLLPHLDVGRVDLCAKPLLHLYTHTFIESASTHAGCAAGITRNDCAPMEGIP